MFRKLSVLLVSVLLILSLAAVGVLAQSPLPVKNVIFLIGDGMGIGAVQLGRNALVGPDGRLAMETFPVVGLATTFSADSAVTDSAAAGTALATGHKTNNGMVAVLPDGTAVTTILEAAQKKGMATGLISTNTLYDATPATFGSHWGTRGGSAEISAQLIDNGIDVLLGGGTSYFLPKGVDVGKRTDGRNLVEEALKSGYTVAMDKLELASATGPKVLGLFTPSYMNYQLDRVAAGTSEPTLAEMASKALEVLSESDNGFFVMIEGARIDHAAHAADFPGVIAEMKDFDDTVEIARDFAREHPDTLLVVTADHDTLGLSVTEPMDYGVFANVSVSPEYMALTLKKGADGKFTEDSIRAAFATYAKITDLKPEEIAAVQEQSKSYSYIVGYAIGAIIAARAHAGFVDPSVRAMGTTGGHTGNMVPVYAYGPGAQVFGGVLDNTQIPRRMAALIGATLSE